MEATTVPRKLWEHADPKNTAMWKFMQETNTRFGLHLQTFNDLYTWSCTNRAQFFGQLWEAENWLHEGSCKQVVDEICPISQLPVWFEGVYLNFAENFLFTRDGAGQRSTRHKEDGEVAIVEIREGYTSVKNITWGELRERVGNLAGALKQEGVKQGDRVVAVGQHSVDTFVVMMATTWLGGVFSSSSTDMGVGGLLQRTVQINPKIVFFDDGALYNGKVVDLRDKIAGLVAGMKDCDQFQNLVVVKRFDKPLDTSGISQTQRLESLLKSSRSTSPPIARVAFQNPAIIYYSSGTTGTPKAIVHGVGPLLLNMWKESVLHRNLNHMDTALQYTTTGWIMYLSSVGHLSIGGRAIFYDGSPFIPDINLLLKIVSEQGVSSLGVNPRWLGELMKAGIVPRKEYDLSKLTTVSSTGMVLSNQLFEWFYDVAFPEHAHLCNISGGTDIAGCFAIDNPLTPVYVGGCQGGALGTTVAVFDHNLPSGSTGTPLPDGTPGDLVAPVAFPNTPICLWNDSPTSPGPKYKSAYFSRFESVWAQGDFCMIHPVTKNIIMLGRSDGVLNPSGVRFGSADIYAVMERFFGPEVRESICVGQRRPQDDDERVVLFLLMKDDAKLTRPLLKRMRETIAKELTKRHVPKFIFEMPEVPVTVNGKKVELPVKHIISGRVVKPSGTLLNPQSLEYFYRFQEIEQLKEPREKL